MGLFSSLFGSGPDVAGINANELDALLKEGDPPILVDVRSAFEFDHDGHIAGARLLPLQDLMRHAGELPQDEEIVVVCRSGNRSMVACQQLQGMGFSKIKNFRGGMIAWSMAGLPME